MEAFKKNFSARAGKSALARAAQPVEVWFQDESGSAEKSDLSTGRKGSTPRAPMIKSTQSDRTCSGRSAPIAAPARPSAAGGQKQRSHAATFDEIAQGRPRREPPFSSSIQAGWHGCQQLRFPPQSPILPLPPREPELKTAKKSGPFHAAEWLSNSVLQILRRHFVDHCCYAGTPLSNTVEDHVHCATRLGEHRSSL